MFLRIILFSHIMFKVLNNIFLFYNFSFFSPYSTLVWIFKHYCKIYLVIENFEGTSWRNLTDSGWMKSMVVVTVSGLHKYGRVGQTFGIHLPSYIVQVHSLTWNYKSNNYIYRRGYLVYDHRVLWFDKNSFKPIFKMDHTKLEQLTLASHYTRL